ncbi:hypothetical protein DICVIV_00573 [Dictyocaulus viviparus]|uniref:Uncharacterized protein n=1 Tax=Dictyocaulus viviparus TaxID=29172 RepID=A0A0D8YAR1_DICVI|nr:hypothetical protein DICVIV_00573 [Dictyocaulus viviparus]
MASIDPMKPPLPKKIGVTTTKLLLLVVIGIGFISLERKLYFVNADALRPVVACMGTVYAVSTICAVIGVFLERKSLVHAHVTVVTSLMFTHTLPRYFVDEQKFYAILGPFWMYMGAFILHIMVAVNMCFLQVFNSFITFLDDKLIPQDSTTNSNEKYVNKEIDESNSYKNS